jgi:hypothetical protein
MEETEERWRELCAQAAVEQDPKKLLALVTEITRLLGEKYDHAKTKPEKPLKSSGDKPAGG